ncbi:MULTISPECIES: hypothetical protein [Stenotrophomonas]|uniref:hypothetical protein n=1 Tax=Stenotrophomonas TaxID=40323 RepID=UPI000B69AEE0|nr:MULTISPECIES: hypothetical protein [Stenotrophomonas]SMR80764.1 hypothetical protein SAMN04487863_2967 [Stenotrophomonas sp. yr243]SNS42193.1 hypothetical protein SAMN05518671_0459 [Stenotrophomonas lactitubi]
MPDLLPDYPRLHALLGDAVRDLPNALAEKMEDALSDAAESVPPSAFFTFLQGHGKGHCADGKPWADTRLTPGRAFDLALATRSASGIAALIAMLHAAHIARENDDPGFYPSAALVDGLFDACEALSLQVERCLVP